MKERFVAPVKREYITRFSTLKQMNFQDLPGLVTLCYHLRARSLTLKIRFKHPKIGSYSNTDTREGEKRTT